MRTKTGSLTAISKQTGNALCCVGATFLLMLPVAAQAINCRISLGPINFGIYMPLTTVPVDVVGQFDVRCQAQPGTFEVIIGAGISGDQLARTLSAGGANILNYNLYRDAARTQIWGDGTPPTFTVTGSSHRVAVDQLPTTTRCTGAFSQTRHLTRAFTATICWSLFFSSDTGTKIRPKRLESTAFC